MPLYEFYCPPCAIQFEVLRPMSRSEDTAMCPSGHQTANRVVSMFATLRKTADGTVQEIGSGGGCACGGACACAAGGH